MDVLSEFFCTVVKKQNDNLLAITSGGLLILIFPNFAFGLLAWVALVPLFFAIKNKNLLNSFRLGAITGLIHFGGILYWITPTVVNYGHLSRPVGFLVFILLILYLSLYMAAFTSLLTVIKIRMGVSFGISAPFLWVCLEYLRAILFSGFPWESLGYSQFMNPLIIQIADITGVYGVSFLIVLVNSTVFGIICLKEREEADQLARYGSVTLIILFLVVGYGYWRLQAINAASDGSGTIKIGLIQGNIDQKRKWDPSFQQETIDVYRELTYRAADGGLDLVVWPETATPFYFQEHEQYRPFITNIPKTIQAFLLFGTPAYDYREDKVIYFNRAYLINPRGAIQGKYDKIHLVPFGEYVPLRSLLFFIKKMVEEVGDFTPGDSTEPLQASFGKFGVLICFEGIFSDPSRKFVKKGADFLVNITNDAWFGKSSAPFQHLSMVIFRAVENRVFVVRSANSGISAFIDPFGRIVSKTSIFSREFLTGRIKLTKNKLTFYTAHGNVFAHLCIAVFLTLVFIMTHRKRRKND